MKIIHTPRATISGQNAALISLTPSTTLHRFSAAAAHASCQNGRSIHSFCLTASLTSSMQKRTTNRPLKTRTRLQAAFEPAPGLAPTLRFVVPVPGAVHTLLLMPGVSTVGDVRQMAAESTGWPVAQVRLAYAGIELPRPNDAQLFQVKAGNTVLHTTKLEAQTAEPTVTAFQVRTMDGRMHKIPIQPGTTTGRDIRAAVADKMGSSLAEVRLSYAGKEVDPNTDDQVFAVNPRITAMQAMQRMQGGQAAAAATGPRARKHGNTTSPGGTRAAPGAGRGFSAQVQLGKQFRDLMKNPMPGVSVAPDELDEMKWHVKLAGPAGTPYEGGWFAVDLLFPDDFPGRRPHIRFVTPIWHPNVSLAERRVCVDLGNDVRSVSCILSALQMLLAHPNADSPLNHECAKMMVCSTKLYEQTAKEMTQQHAMG